MELIHDSNGRCGDPLELCVQEDVSAHFLSREFHLLNLKRRDRTLPWGYYCWFRLLAEREMHKNSDADAEGETSSEARRLKEVETMAKDDH